MSLASRALPLALLVLTVLAIPTGVVHVGGASVAVHGPGTLLVGRQDAPNPTETTGAYSADPVPALSSLAYDAESGWFLGTTPQTPAGSSLVAFSSTNYTMVANASFPREGVGSFAIDSVNGSVFDVLSNGSIAVLSEDRLALVAEIRSESFLGPIRYDPINGDLYAGTTTGVAQIDPQNLSLLSETPVVAAPWAVDTSNGNVALVGTDNVTLLSGTNRSILATLPGLTGGWDAMSFDPASGNFYFLNVSTSSYSAASPGEVYAINGTSGHLVATLDLPSMREVFPAVVPSERRIYIAGATGIEAISDSTNSVVGTFDLACLPGALVSDGANGDLYVQALCDSGITVFGFSEAKSAETVSAAPSTPNPGEQATDFLAAEDPFSGVVLTAYLLDSGAGELFAVGPYEVTFSAALRTLGANWTVSLVSSTGVTERIASPDPTITVLVPNGSYRYSISLPAGYVASPSSGSVTVSGAAGRVTVTISYAGWLWATLGGLGALLGALAVVCRRSWTRLVSARAPSRARLLWDLEHPFEPKPVRPAPEEKDPLRR